MTETVPLKQVNEPEAEEVVSATDARQGNTLGVMRYVLAISLMLAATAFIIIYAVYFWPA